MLIEVWQRPLEAFQKKELDPEGIPQFGLVAEQVEKVNPDLVVRDEDGKVTTVRYEAINAMLLNQFLKEHRKSQPSRAQSPNSRRPLHNSRSRLRH